MLAFDRTSFRGKGNNGFLWAFCHLEHHSDTLVSLLFFSSETLYCKIIDYQKLSVENYSSQEEAVYTYW